MNAPPEKDAHHDMQIQDPELTLQVKEERLSSNISCAFVQCQFVFLSLCPELMSICLFVFFKPARGLRAESSRICTVESHSGKGEDFLTGQLIFFTETAVTPERKVEKSILRWKINCHAEG